MILVVTLKETYFFFYEGIFPVSMLDLQFDAAILHNIAKFLYLQFQLLMNNPNLARQLSAIT
jgi:hypothetical protein